MKESVSVLKEALLTEKATALSANHNQYVFSVDPSRRKEILKISRASFGVTVLKVNTFIVKPKSKRDRMRRNKLVTLLMLKKQLSNLRQAMP